MSCDPKDREVTRRDFLEWGVLAGGASALSARLDERPLREPDGVYSGDSTGVINVKDPPYGAKGDGAKDDAAAIQSAINAAGDRTAGGVVFFPPGRYLITEEIVFGSNTAMIGSGREITTVVVAPRARGGMRSLDFDKLDGSGASQGTKLFRIAHLTLDGNKAQGSTGDGLSIYGAAYILQDISIRNFTGWGLRTAGNGRGGGEYGWVGVSLEARYLQLLLQDNDSGNWRHGGPNDSIAADLTLVMQHRTGGRGPVSNLAVVRNGPGTGGAGLQICNSHFWGSHARYQAHLQEAACRFVNLVLEGAYDAQLFIDLPDGGAESLVGLHVFGQNEASQKGIVVGGMSSGMVEAHGGRCPGGFLVLNGLHGSPGGGQGDYGGNVFLVAMDDECVGVPNRRSKLMGTDRNGPIAG